MYEILMRSRWIIAAFFAVTIGSIVTYASNRPADPASARVAAAASTSDQGAAVDADAAAEPGPTRSGSPDDHLIDKTVGEDVRPEEEKEAEAAALAAAAAAQRVLPMPAGADEEAAAE